MVARGRENDRRWTIRGYISTFGLAGARFDGYICCFEPLGFLGRSFCTSTIRSL